MGKIGYWVVGIMAQEFWRGHRPLGAELRERVQSALRAVEGVTAVDEHDNETWDVTGVPSGEALIRAAGRGWITWPGGCGQAGPRAARAGFRLLP